MSNLEYTEGGQRDSSGLLHGGVTVTASNVTDGAKVVVLIDNNNWDGTNSSLTGQVEFTGQSAEYIDTGETKSVHLGENGVWSKKFTISGDGHLSDSDVLPATHNGQQCFYTISETSVPEGYKLDWISENKVTSGVLSAYNRSTTADLTVVKVDEENKASKLNGAEFGLWKLDPNHTGATRLDSEPVRIITGVDGSNGSATFSPLEIGGYYEVAELNAPAGYILNGKTSFYVKVTEDGVYRIRKDDEKTPPAWSYASDDSVITYKHGTATISNEPGKELPNTGGFGTTALYIFGGLLVIAALAIVFRGQMARRAHTSAKRGRRGA